jgi:hypothetical protein
MKEMMMLLLVGGVLIGLGFYLGRRRQAIIHDAPVQYPQADTSSVAQHADQLQSPMAVTATAPRMVQPLRSLTVLAGEGATFHVEAEGPCLSYQWSRNGVAILGAISASLEIENLTGTENGHLFSVEVSNEGGRVQSGPAMLRVVTLPRITRQPVDVRLKHGEKAMLEAQAEGTGPLTFQWFREDQPIPDATLPFLEVTTALSALKLQVKNPWGEVTSRTCQVAMLTPPVIMTEPNSITLFPGEKATFTVEAESSIPATYQWHRNGNPIPGAVGTTLHLPLVTEEDNEAEYQVTISNAAGMVQSRFAKVGVHLSRLTVGAPDRPELELSRWNGMPVKTRDIKMTPSLKSRMGMMVQPGMSLIQQGVNLAQQGRIVENTFKIVFSPEVTQGLREGTYRFMEGVSGHYATAVNSSGRIVGKGQIVGNGSLMVNNAARAAAMATAVFQVLAVVTAQKFLADIDKKLASIDKGVKAIQNWLEDGEWARLQAGHDYLMGIAKTIQDQRLSQPEVTAFLNQLEHIERDSQRIAQMALKKLVRLGDDLPAVSRSLRSKGVQDDVDALQKMVDDWKFYAHGLMGALRLRGAAAQLRCSLPVIAGPSRHRIQSIQTCLEEMDRVNNTFAGRLANKAEQFRSTFGGDTTSAIRNNFLDQTRQFTKEFQDLREEMRDTLDALQVGLGEMDIIEQKGVAMLVTLNADGEVESLAQIEEQSA